MRSLEHPARLFHVSSGMRKGLFFLLLLSFHLTTIGQEISGSWIMTYIKAKQPVFTMIQQDGELTLEDETPQDSTIIYSPGLMLMKPFSKDSAISYSWEDIEKWSFERLDGQVWFYGVRDSLYGAFDAEGRLVLSSTVDDRPTDYVFEKQKFAKSASKLQVENTTWNVSAEDSFLNDQILSFKKDSVLTSELNGKAEFGEYYIHPIEGKFAIEFVVNTPKAHIGIMYITKVSRKKMEGVFYALVEDGIRPKRTKITLRR
ncbi:MAG: hypothetical protein HEP71_23800 [Roseivirga sp.]|nr:hypothetical protein [Roseivirga sp.]